jgi:hypothetical protein
LLRKGVNPNLSDYDGRTSLHIASSNNYIKIAKKLLKHRDINVNFIDNFDMTPYHEAIRHGFEEMAELLRSFNGVIVHRDLGYRLCLAAKEGDLEGIKKMKKDKADLNTADYDLRTALHLATCEGNYEIVEYLLNSNVNPHVKDCFRRTPIDDAHKYGYKNIIELFGKNSVDSVRT